MGNAPTETPQDQQLRDALVALTPRLRRFALSICRNACQADDLVQDTLMKAWQCRAQFQGQTVPQSWLFTVLRHHFIDERRRSLRNCGLDQEVAENTLYAISDPDKILELDELRRAMASLQIEQREAVLLIGAGGLAYEEAAKVCGAKIGTLKSRASRGRARLREILETGQYAADGESCGNAMAIIFAQVAGIQDRVLQAA